MKVCKIDTNLMYALANYTIVTHNPVRTTAKIFNIPKTKVHNYLHIYLKEENHVLFDAVDKIMQENKAIAQQRATIKAGMNRKGKNRDKN